MKNVFEKVFYLSGDEDLIKIAIGKKKQIENYVIKVTSENMELYSHVAFPKKGIGEYKRIFDYVRFLGNVEESIYVDGILIERERSIRLSGQLDQVLKDDILKDSIINYVGSKRPILSIDRNSCVAFPNMELELEIIKDGFVEELCRIITKHILKEHMSTDDPEQLMILDIIARKFPSILEKLLRKLKISQNMKITLDKNFVEKNKYILDDIFSKEQLWLNDVDFRSYMEITRQTILGRSITADEIKVEDLNVIIRGGKCQEVIDSTYMHPYYEQISLEIMAICADEWKGRFREYDIVNKIWPVVNQDLYKCLNCEGLISERTNRCKMLYDMDEIIEIANLDPVLVHPVYGISSRGNRRFEDGESQVGEFYKNQRKYKLNEMTGYGRLTSEKKVSYALYVYIASRDLDETDQQKLEEYKEKDPDYVRGVKEGWSILFLGECQKYVICPGIVPRAEMAQKVKEDYRKLTPDITYLYSDGTKVFDE